MNCPRCGVPACGSDGEIRVIESRPTPSSNSIRRRRQCVCGLRFTTSERIISTRRGTGVEAGNVDLADLKVMRSQLAAITAQVSSMTDVIDAAIPELYQPQTGPTPELAKL